MSQEILAHCRKRIGDYSRWIELIPKGIDFDIKPFYGAIFRSPFSNVNYYPVEPKQPDLFREVLLRMFIAACGRK